MHILSDRKTCFERMQSCTIAITTCGEEESFTRKGLGNHDKKYLNDYEYVYNNYLGENNHTPYLELYE